MYGALPEEGAKSPGAGVIDNCELPCGWLGIKSWSYVRSASENDLNCCLSSPKFLSLLPLGIHADTYGFFMQDESVLCEGGWYAVRADSGTALGL